jgi:nitroimidazol reductase NimA-like FMN-containing flavoprotein (pyridoxamine 5'-phosphate oxidase superfamily)
LSYTQSPHLTSEEIESFLQEARIARFCSYNRDGTIHAAPVWYKYENGKMVIGTPLKSRKARNVMRNGSVTVLVDVEGPPTRGVIMYGKAEVEESSIDDMIPMAMSIFRRYMPEDETRVYAEGLGKISEWVKITVTPFRLSSFDYSKDELYRKATRGLL